MVTKLKDAPEKRIPKEECNHHWIIETANGPTSRGVCKLSGAEQEFYNWLPEIPVWHRGGGDFGLADVLGKDSKEKSAGSGLEEEDAGLPV